MMMIESTMAIRFLAGTNFYSSAALPHSGAICNAEDVPVAIVVSRWPFHSGYSNISWSNLVKNRIRASAADPVKKNGTTRFHPSEDIVESGVDIRVGVDARLAAAETRRTITEAVVDIEDFRKAQPDAIVHSAAKIISRLKAGGEKTTQALNSLCWRSRCIPVEEAALIGVDSLGFDLRVCSGTQIKTLRFSFNTQATAAYSAERQPNDLSPGPNRSRQKRNKRIKMNVNTIKFQNPV